MSRRTPQPATEELRRLPEPGGPALRRLRDRLLDTGYFALTRYLEDYAFDGQTVRLTLRHRPLHVMAEFFAAA